MNVQDFERVAEAFQEFHSFFAPAFGRKECRENSQQYLHALLVQAQERKNVENLAETVPASPRVLQRFLTEATWDDQAVTEQLHRYLAPRLNDPEGVFIADESAFPKQGLKSVGVARQYCGTLGKIANCQMGVFLAYVSERGRALVDKALYLPEAWIEDPERCDEAGVPKHAQVLQTKPQLALHLLERARAWGHLQANWVAADDSYGQSPEFRDRLTAAGFWYVLDVPSNTLTWTRAPHLGWQRLKFEERAAALSASDWQPITVGEGAQGERTYLFACEPVHDNRDQKPVVALVALYRMNLDGSEPRYYFAHAPMDTPLDKLARVAAARWSIETEFETNKDDVGLDEYEVRGWAGWHHHITLCLLASAFLLSLQQKWGEKDAPDYASTGLPGRTGTVAQTNLDARGLAALARRDPTPQRTRPLFASKATTSPVATKSTR
jgi:SRSO17 transposase